MQQTFTHSRYSSAKYKIQSKRLLSIEGVSSSTFPNGSQLPTWWTKKNIYPDNEKL